LELTNPVVQIICDKEHFRVHNVLQTIYKLLWVLELVW